MPLRPVLLISAVLAAVLHLGGCADGALNARGGGSEAPAAASADGLPPGTLVLSGTCNAAAANDAIGKPATAALQSELVTRTLAKTLRVIRAGQPVTQEFSSQRLNLEVDGTGRITAVRCG